MENLLNLLNKIENNSEIQKTNYLTDGYFHELHEDIQEVTRIACEELITNGSCNWNNISKLKELGYNVFPGESDSFGWLSGCIKTKKGIIVYG